MCSCYQSARKYRALFKGFATLMPARCRRTWPDMSEIPRKSKCCAAVPVLRHLRRILSVASLSVASGLELLATHTRLITGERASAGQTCASVLETRHRLKYIEFKLFSLTAANTSIDRRNRRDTFSSLAGCIHSITGSNSMPYILQNTCVRGPLPSNSPRAQWQCLYPHHRRLDIPPECQYSNQNT